jgi:hypothetical protein
MSTGPKLRTQPPKAPQVDPLARLQALESWSEEPAKAQADALAANRSEGEGLATPAMKPSEHSQPSTATKPSDAAEPSKASKPSYPWDGVDDGQSHQFNIKIPKALYLRLKWLGDTTYGTSMTQIAIQGLEARAAKMLKERGIK